MRKIQNLKYLLIGLGLLILIGFELNYLYERNVAETSAEDAFDVYTEQVDRIFEDLQCFPVVKEDHGYPVNYSNSWKTERSYGGKRLHEGCDLMAVTNERGRYSVCSMTDGIVKNIGWLEQGGWRIGIESEAGIYYYYAHLDSYEKAFEIGEPVVAGQILGRMGDSGYGKTPGTKGKFDVHLHVGIYIKDLSGKERAVNPFWFLKQLEI